jgi:lipoprotein-anchoring transpeptidase ErfK/SrfK
MFFTEDGKAIHGTPMAAVRSFLHTYVTDDVGSKGCVGLAEDNAKTMFEWTPLGTEVEVLTSERNPDEVPQLEQ